MKLKYIGETFGFEGLTDGKVYECLEIDGEFFRVIDDSDEDYLYPVIRPRPLDGSSKGGKWEVVEDDNGKLQEALDYWGEWWKKHGR